MRQTRTRLPPLFAAFLFMLSGCAATGIKVSEQQAASFQPGKATYTEVVTALGQPSSVTTMPDGSRMALYIFAQAQARPETFIPVVGAFVGGVDSRSSSVIFRFGPDGKLLDHISSVSNMGTGTGLAAGQPMPDRTNQPRQDN